MEAEKKGSKIKREVRERVKKKSIFTFVIVPAAVAVASEVSVYKCADLEGKKEEKANYRTR